MTNFLSSVIILFRSRQPQKLTREPLSTFLYFTLLRSLIVLTFFGIGLLFAFRFFGLNAFSSYYLLSWLLVIAMVPKALRDQLAAPDWLSYLSLPISRTTWKAAQLSQFVFTYGYVLLLPLSFGLVWSLLVGQLSTFFAFSGLWLLGCSFIFVLSTKLVPWQQAKKLRVFGQMAFWVLVISNFFLSLSPNAWPFLAWLQRWLSAPFTFSHYLCFFASLGYFYYCFHNWKLVPSSLEAAPKRQLLLHNPTWEWLKQVLMIKGLLNQWLTNLWLILIACFFLLWQLLPEQTLAVQTLTLVVLSSSIFGLLSLSWTLYSCIHHELRFLRSLPFKWQQDYWLRVMTAACLQLSQLLLFSLLSGFFLPLAVISLALLVTAPLVVASCAQAISSDLCNPLTHWQSPVELLRPTWQRVSHILLMICYLFLSFVCFNLFLTWLIALILASCFTSFILILSAIRQRNHWLSS